MKNMYMLLNNVDIGISSIELNEFNLIVKESTKKYQFIVTVLYNWKDINLLKPGESKVIDFNEYILGENNESALIWPANSYVKKVDEKNIIFYFNFNFDDLTDITYMNKRGHFDIEINSLEVKVQINYDDAKNGLIKYNYT